MQIMIIVSVVLFYSFCTQLGQSLDCSLLTHIDPPLQEPANGLDLPYCQTSEDQCCTREYLHKLKNETLEYLEWGLQRELLMGDNYNILSSITNETHSYLQLLVKGFIDRLPGAYAIDSDNREDLIDLLAPIITGSSPSNMAPPSLILTNTTLNNIIQRLLKHVIQDYVQRNNVFSMTDLTANCYRDKLYEGYINTSYQSELVLSVHKLLTTISLLNEITNFYTNQLIPQLSSMRLPTQCIERSLSLKCESCREAIPDLCPSVCKPLLLGCYSPYRIPMVGQLNVLWNVTNQVVQVAREQADNVLWSMTTPTRLLTLDLESTTDVQNFITSTAVSCSFIIINFAPKTSPDLPPVSFPTDITDNATKLEGSFKYFGSGPLMCETNPKMNCWNGEEIVPMDSSHVDFDTDNIIDQNNNPVVSYNRSELVQIAVSIGTPVSDFLIQESIQQIIPSGVLVPSANEFQLDIPRDSISTTATIPSPSMADRSPSSSDIPRRNTDSAQPHTQSKTVEVSPTNGLMQNTEGDGAKGLHSQATLAIQGVVVLVSMITIALMSY